MYYNKNIIKKIIPILLFLLLITACGNSQNIIPGVGVKEYYRLDLKDLDSMSPLGNLRIITKGHYQLKEAKDKYHLDKNYIINEKELVESVGFEYINIPCIDHIWPSEKNIDKFIEFVKTINMDDTWIHFHCVAGEGRTGTFMCLYDMMKNPDVHISLLVIHSLIF